MMFCESSTNFFLLASSESLMFWNFARFLSTCNQLRVTRAIFVSDNHAYHIYCSLKTFQIFFHCTDVLHNRCNVRMLSNIEGKMRK